jgi:kynurenine formamidase
MKIKMNKAQYGIIAFMVIFIIGCNNKQPNVDVLSFDPGVDEKYTGHKTLFEAGKWGVECVANLNKIPKIGATVIVAAPKVGKATGGFSRIIAVW